MNDDKIQLMLHLKRCPFCGSHGSVEDASMPGLPDLGHYRVICAGCFCETKWYGTMKEATKAWNRRAT